MADAALRAKNALVGGFVADAATMPLHWLYGAEKINAGMGAKSDKPEFFETPSCPYYSSKEHPGHYSLGQPSPYGEEALALLTHMVKNSGDFKSPDAFADDLLMWGETFGGRPNHCTKEFILHKKTGAKYPECGADDGQANSLIKAVVITTRYYGKPELMEKVEEAVRTHQDNDIAVLYAQAAARLLERVILGEPLQTVLTKPDEGMDHDVVDAMAFARENKVKSIWEFVDVLGARLKLEQAVFATSCKLPGAYIAALYLLEKHGAASTYETVLRDNIRMGGDNCSRAIITGALLAAAGGIPGEWKSKVKDIESYDKMADVLLAARAKH